MEKNSLYLLRRWQRANVRPYGKRSEKTGHHGVRGFGYNRGSTRRKWWLSSPSDPGDFSDAGARQHSLHNTAGLRRFRYDEAAWEDPQAVAEFENPRPLLDDEEEYLRLDNDGATLWAEYGSVEALLAALEADQDEDADDALPFDAVAEDINFNPFRHFLR